MGTSCQVLLLSAFPDAHEPMMDSLGRHGIEARVALSTRDAREWLARHPDVVLVDLVHGTGVDAKTVSAVNRERGRALVVALHEGNFGEFCDQVSGLNVDGFCRVGDWKPIVNATRGDHTSTSFALH